MREDINSICDEINNSVFDLINVIANASNLWKLEELQNRVYESLQDGNGTISDRQKEKCLKAVNNILAEARFYLSEDEIRKYADDIYSQMNRL